MRRSVVAAAIFTAALATIANAQDASKSAAPAAAQAGSAEPYQPGLGEIMALQQMRHIKLWFAGSAGNWPLADYEIGELNEGFDDVKNLLGGDIVEQHVGAPIAALQKAIDSKNRAAFAAAFDKLSAGCNACHHALDHGFIVIQRPSVLPYSNQSFAVPK
jgi:cytochrome c556